MSKNTDENTNEQQGTFSPALVVKSMTVAEKGKYFLATAATTGGVLELMGAGFTGLAIAAVAGGTAAYFSEEIRNNILDHLPAPKPCTNNKAINRLATLNWWFTGRQDAPLAQEPEQAGQEGGAIDVPGHEVETEKLTDDAALFPVWNPDDTGGIARLSIEQIVSHIEPNSYRIYVGRSLTKPGNPAIPISIYKQHFRFMGASQRGKSSMIAAFLDIVTRTHDKRHVLVAILDKEDQTGNLFADLPHIPTLQIGGDRIRLHARNNEQVLEYLMHIVAVMEARYQLGKLDIVRQPILLVYIEEFLSLKNYFKARMESARGDAKEEATADYRTLVYCIEELAQRGLKVRVQLLLSAQVEYADDDFKEAMASVGCGFAFCVRPSAAQAAGFRNGELLKRNAKDNKIGQAVVETPDCNDLILAPEFDLEARLIELEKRGSVVASNIRPLRPDVEPTQRPFVARKTQEVDPQNTLEMEDVAPVFARKNSALRPLVEPTQTTQNDATTQKYRLSEEQVKMFLSLYPDVIPNKDKALDKIGANSAYRAHANELILQHNLDRKHG